MCKPLRCALGAGGFLAGQSLEQGKYMGSYASAAFLAPGIVPNCPFNAAFSEFWPMVRLQMQGILNRRAGNFYPDSREFIGKNG
jgi:hypothetical protein